MAGFLRMVTRILSAVCDAVAKMLRKGATWLMMYDADGRGRFQCTTEARGDGGEAKIPSMRVTITV